MNTVRRTLRQTLTVARRDFVATVFTPAFLLFLLAPIVMAGFGLVGSLGATTATQGNADKLRIVAILDPGDAPAFRTIDDRLRDLYRSEEEAPATLRIDTPAGDVAAQARALFEAHDIEAAAVLYGSLDRPTILYAPRARRAAAYLAEIAEQTLRAERSGGTAPLSHPRQEEIRRAKLTASGKSEVAFLSTFGLFFLTLLLAGQAVGTMAEERSNKVIEVLAAAVPLESVFLGKLIGMFGSALVFILFWGTIIANIAKLLPPGAAHAIGEMGPAVGIPAFPLLFFAYFAMAYMLLGAVFLGVGAQASTPREIQMLSLPITIFQVSMFGFSSAAASHPGTWISTAAEIFPFSSPFAMAARAANSPELWPHALALAWQLLWVAITVTAGARLFRRGVLQSGSPALRLKAWFGRRSAIDIHVN